MSQREIPKILQVTDAHSGCAFWRMLWMGHFLNMKGDFSVFLLDRCTRDILDYARMSAIHLQRKGLGSDVKLFEKIGKLRDRFKLRILYDTDDLLFYEDIPDYNHMKQKLSDYIDQFPNLIKTIELCDEITVTTHTLKENLLRKTNQKKITVIPNYPPAYLWGHLSDEKILRRNFRKHQKKPRILFAGSSTHFENRRYIKEVVDDFTPVRDAVLSSISEFTWVFVGAYPHILTPLIEKGLVEFHRWVPLSDYPKFLANLEANMAIAPLWDNEFNRAKSDLKFLEASALGLPIACQDMCTYAIAPIRFKTGDEMLEQIRKTLADEEGYIEASREARRRLCSRWLENKDNYGKYYDLYSYPYDSSSRKYL